MNGRDVAMRILDLVDTQLVRPTSSDPRLVLSEFDSVLAILSTGERTLVLAAWAAWNGHPGCDLADLLHLPDTQRVAVLAALADLDRT